jgi:hypothetical protein
MYLLVLIQVWVAAAVLAVAAAGAVLIKQVRRGPMEVMAGLLEMPALRLLQVTVCLAAAAAAGGVLQVAHHPLRRFQVLGVKLYS